MLFLFGFKRKFEPIAGYGAGNEHDRTLWVMQGV
jgi:hypothetical protein